MISPLRNALALAAAFPLFSSGSLPTTTTTVSLLFLLGNQHGALAAKGGLKGGGARAGASNTGDAHDESSGRNIHQEESGQQQQQRQLYYPGYPGNGGQTTCNDCGHVPNGECYIGPWSTPMCKCKDGTIDRDSDLVYREAWRTQLKCYGPNQIGESCTTEYDCVSGVCGSDGNCASQDPTAAPTAHPCSVPPELAGDWFWFEQKDVPGNDIINRGRHSDIRSNFDWCNNNAECEGFNTHGYMKKNLPNAVFFSDWPMTQDTCNGIYVKKSVVEKPACQDYQPCPSDSICYDSASPGGQGAENGDYACVCNQGYETTTQDAHGATSCEPTCAANLCPTNSICTDGASAGSYQCACNQGYVSTGQTGAHGVTSCAVSCPSNLLTCQNGQDCGSGSCGAFSSQSYPNCQSNTCTACSGSSACDFTFDQNFRTMAYKAAQNSHAIYFSSPRYEAATVTFGAKDFQTTNERGSVVGYDNNICIVTFRGMPIPKVEDFLNPLTSSTTIDRFSRDFDNAHKTGRATSYGCAVLKTYSDSLGEFDFASLERETTACMAHCTAASDCKLIMAGHSRGGGIASIAAAAMKDKNPWVMTFGSVPTFVDGACANINDSRYFRFVKGGNEWDPVPQHLFDHFSGDKAKWTGNLIVAGNDNNDVKFYGETAVASSSHYGSYPSGPSDMTLVINHFAKEYKNLLRDDITSSGNIGLTGYDDGKTCNKGWECRSGSCTALGKCYTKKNNGEGCFLGSDCKSGRCAVPDFKCAAKLGRGGFCSTGEDCLSGTCHGLVVGACG